MKITPFNYNLFLALCNLHHTLVITTFMAFAIAIGAGAALAAAAGLCLNVARYQFGRALLPALGAANIALAMSTRNV